MPLTYIAPLPHTCTIAEALFIYCVGLGSIWECGECHKEWILMDYPQVWKPCFNIIEREIA